MAPVLNNEKYIQNQIGRLLIEHEELCEAYKFQKLAKAYFINYNILGVIVLECEMCCTLSWYATRRKWYQNLLGTWISKPNACLYTMSTDTLVYMHMLTWKQLLLSHYVHVTQRYTEALHVKKTADCCSTFEWSSFRETFYTIFHAIVADTSCLMPEAQEGRRESRQWQTDIGQIP